jgi:chromate transport protein ChrA
MHRFVTTTFIGLWAVLGSAAALVPVAGQLLVGGTSVLWQNEMRPELEEVVAASQPIDAQRTGAHDGQFVSVTAPLTTDDPQRDATFFARGDFYSVVRVVETFAWVEQRSERRTKRWGGGQQVDSVIEYVQLWTDNPLPSSAFEHPDGHDNPAPRHRTQIGAPLTAKVGAWNIAPAATLVLAGQPLAEDDVSWTAAGRALIPAEDGWRYDRAGAETAAELGDQRFRWVVVPLGAEVTVFGDASGDWVGPHAWVDGLAVAVAVPGTRADALSLFRGLDLIVLWVVRFAGTAAVWLGLMWLVGPLLVLVDVIPPLGTGVRIIVGVAFGVVAVVWTATLVTAANVAQSPLMLLLLAGLAYILLRAWWDHRREQRDFERASEMSEPSPA